MNAARATQPRCSNCGRFVATEDLAEGTAWLVHVEPDTPFGPERHDYFCRYCVLEACERAAGYEEGGSDVTQFAHDASQTAGLMLGLTFVTAIFGPLDWQILLLITPFVIALDWLIHIIRGRPS